jgi:hypothetical protein
MFPPVIVSIFIDGLKVKILFNESVDTRPFAAVVNKILYAVFEIPDATVILDPDPVAPRGIPRLIA